MIESTLKPLDPEVLKQLIAEALRIEEDAIHSAKGHFEGSDIWSYRNLCVGLPTTLVAGVAGVTAISHYPVLGGILALLVAGSSAVHTFLNPAERAAAHLKAGNAYKALQNDARIFRTIESVQRADDAALVSELKTLSDRRNSLNSESPQPSRNAFTRARKGINEGEASYAVDGPTTLPK